MTYHIGVDDISGGSGGELHLTVDTPGVDLKVDRFGRFDPKTGVATRRRHAHMPERNSRASVSGELSQRTTSASTGQNPIVVPCNGAAQPWSIAFTPLDGKFKGGPADVLLGVSVCCLPGGGIGQTVIQRATLRG